MICIWGIRPMPYLYQIIVAAFRNVIWVKLAQLAEPIFLT